MTGFVLALMLLVPQEVPAKNSTGARELLRSALEPVGIFIGDTPPGHFLNRVEAGRRVVDIFGGKGSAVPVEFSSNLTLNDIYNHGNTEKITGRFNHQGITFNSKYFHEGTAPFHEFWHAVQRDALGGYPHLEEMNNRLGHKSNRQYEVNQFEREASLVGNELQKVYDQKTSPLWKVLARTPLGRYLGTSGMSGFEAAVPETIGKLMPEIREIWADSPIRPKHLKKIEADLKAIREGRPVRKVELTGELLDPLLQARTIARDVMVKEAGGVANFAAAYLLKEGLIAIEQRDPGHLTAAAAAFRTGTFWKGIGTFTGAAGGTNLLLGKFAPGLRSGLAGQAIPLAMGIGAVQAVNGEFSLKNTAISSGSFLGTSMALNVTLGRFLPKAGLGGMAANLGLLTLTLYLGEKIENQIHRSLQSRRPDATRWADPHKEKGLLVGVEGIRSQ